MRPCWFAAAAVFLLSAPAWAKDEAGFKTLEKALRKSAKTLAPHLRGNICVMDFSDLSDVVYTSEFGQKVAELMSNQLVNKSEGRYRVVERRELIKIMNDSILILGDDEQVVKNFEEKAGMDVLVSGSYSISGPEISIDIKAVDAHSGLITGSANARIKKTEGLEKMLARRFKQFGPADDKERNPKPPEDGPTAAVHGPVDVLELESGVFYEGGDGRLYPLRQGMVLNSADNYAIYVKPKQPCYVYVYQVDSSQKAFKIFPNKELATGGNPLSGAKEYWIPNDKEFLYLDNNPGREELYVFATRAPALGLENLKEAKLSEINEAIRTMGVAGKRGSETISKVKATQGNPIDVITRKLAAQGDFYYSLSFIHQ